MLVATTIISHPSLLYLPQIHTSVLVCRRYSALPTLRTLHQSMKPPPSKIGRRALKLAAALGLSNLLFACGDHWYINRRVRKSFERGYGAPVVHREEKSHIARPAELAAITSRLSTTSTSNLYQLISGENGTGKSTLVAEVCNQLKKGDGAGFVYVSVNPDKPFKEALKSALKYEESVSLVGALLRLMGVEVAVSGEVPYLFGKLESPLLNAAEAFKKKYGRPPVLIIDDINKLAKENPRELEHLQDYAKLWADSRSLIVAFVSSEGNGPRLLQGRSAKSRMQRVCEIGDVPIEKAVDFLVRHSVPINIARQAAEELTGGRLCILNEFVTDWDEKTTKTTIAPTTAAPTTIDPIVATANYSKLKSSMLASAENGIRVSQLSATAASTRVVEALFKASDNRISLAKLQELVPNIQTQEVLLRSQIFSFRTSDNTLTFQSNVVKTYFKDKPPKLVGEGEYFGLSKLYNYFRQK